MRVLFFEKRDSGGHGDDLGPFALNVPDGIQFGDMNGGLVIEALVRAQEVVMGDKED